MATKLFDNMKITEGEEEFIKNVLLDDKMPNVKAVYMQQAQVLATLKLSKQIEMASLESDKHTKRMNRLTLALVVFGGCQVIVAIIDLVKKYFYNT